MNACLTACTERWAAARRRTTTEFDPATSRTARKVKIRLDDDDDDESMFSVNLDATPIAGVEYSSPTLTLTPKPSSLAAAAARLHRAHRLAAALGAFRSNVERSKRADEVEVTIVPALRLGRFMRAFEKGIASAKATRMAEEEARLSAAERHALERARSFANERLKRLALNALANRALRKRFEKQLVTSMRQRLRRDRTPSALFRRWCARARRRALLRRVLKFAIKQRRGFQSRRGWRATPLTEYAKKLLRRWRQRAGTLRRERDERRATWRADTARKLRLLLRAFGAWARAREDAAEIRRDATVFFTAFLGWRGEAARLAATRRSLRERRVRRLAELAVRAWRGWRAFVTRIRAAGAMRLRATVRFVKPAFTAWRIVALARARSRVVEAMRIDAASRHAMWRAWRAWSLGPALAAFTAGAPTPAPPVHGDDDAGVGDSPPGDSPPVTRSSGDESRRRTTTSR